MADRFRAGKRLWNPEDDALLVARYPHEPTSTIARDMRRSLSATYGRARILGVAKSAEYMASPEAYRLRRDASPGIPFRFKKGQVPFNKGLRRPGWFRGRMKETQFKKGQKGSRWMPVGARRLVGGYLYTKIADHRCVVWTRNWKPSHVVLWEKHHRRRIPRGYVVAFVNKDRSDVRIDNLELIPRRELARRNRMWNALPRPLAETIQLLGALNRQIRKRTKAHEEQDRRPA